VHAEALQIRGSPTVVFTRVAAVVDGSVKLNREPRTRTVEIDHIPADAMLPPEVKHA
jgi:hypothetical protein